MKTENLVIRLQNEGSEVSTFAINVLQTGEAVQFSAKHLRKTFSAKVLQIINADWKLGASRGKKIAVSVEYLGLHVDLKPVYFGGGRGEKQLKEQLSILIADVKEMIA